MPLSDALGTRGAIGIIGGMGPYAGLDLVQKIFDHTEAYRDHDHLPVAMLSYPHCICDRTSFLFGDIDENPAYALADLARSLETAGASVAAMPCNTAHAAPILDVMQEELDRTGNRIRIISMIEETARAVREHPGGFKRVGVLSSMAVYRLRIYADALEQAGIEAILPDESVEEQLVDAAIFNEEWGIKAIANPVHPRARQSLLEAIDHLRALGAEAVILGCTEFPLAVPEPDADGIPLIDPTVVIARALIRETYPERLRHASVEREPQAA